jgi:hypothetical protein
MRNWFQRWLKQPWMGNYDMMLASSGFVQQFYKSFGERFGHAVTCLRGCPIERAPSLSCTDPEPYFRGIVYQNSSNLDATAKRTMLINCTLTIQSRNNAGAYVTNVIQFRYQYDVKTTKGSILVRPSSSIPTDNASIAALESATSRRVKIPVRVLRIGANTNTFFDKGESKLRLLSFIYHFNFNNYPYDLMTVIFS